MRVTSFVFLSMRCCLPSTSMNGNEADPSLSSDQLLIVFTSSRPGGTGLTDLYYATRGTSQASWSVPALVPGVNSTLDDGDAALSKNACRLYLSSKRTGDFDLYVADVLWF